MDNLAMVLVGITIVWGGYKFFSKILKGSTWLLWVILVVIFILYLIANFSTPPVR